MSARSIWRGSISFGLVNIPVKLHNATEGKEFSFNQLCGKGHRIQYKKWCPVEDREVPWSEVRKGYEMTKDNYVVLEKDDFEKIKIKTSKTIDIREFIDGKDLDPIFIEKSYYVSPDGKTVDKAYSLFVNVLKQTNKIAIGKVVLREKEHLVALRPYQRAIVMHQLHYLDEIRPVEEIEEVAESARAKLDSKELSLGKTLVENLTSKEFDIGQYSDAYAKQLEDLINAKAEGKMVKVKPEEEREATKDLFETLKASVQKSKKRQ